MLQVDHFFHFIELLLPMSIYNLHHLNCTMEDEEMQKKKKKRGILESQERPSPLFSHCPGFLLNLQLLFIHLNSFHSGTDCCLFTSTFSSVQLLSRVRLFVTP